MLPVSSLSDTYVQLHTTYNILHSTYNVQYAALCSMHAFHCRRISGDTPPPPPPRAPPPPAPPPAAPPTFRPILAPLLGSTLVLHVQPTMCTYRTTVQLVAIGRFLSFQCADDGVVNSYCYFVKLQSSTETTIDCVHLSGYWIDSININQVIKLLIVLLMLIKLSS